MQYCALVSSGFSHINLQYNLYKMNEFSWSIYAVNNSIVLSLFFLLQIWSALNWILQIVFDKHFFSNFDSSIFWNLHASFNWKPKACKIKINGYHEEAFAFALSYWIGRNDSLLLECHTVLAFQLRDEIKTTKEISRKTERESVIIDYDNEW